jgi:hypothetical protein
VVQNLLELKGILSMNEEIANNKDEKLLFSGEVCSQSLLKNAKGGIIPDDKACVMYETKSGEEMLAASN